MIATSPNDTSSEPTKPIVENGMLAKKVASLSGHQLCLLSKLFAIRVASKNQALDFGYYMQRMEDHDPQCYLEFIRRELHDHMNIRAMSDSGNNYLDNLAHDAHLFERILTCEEAKTTPAKYTDEGSCDVTDQILLYRFVEIFRQNLQPTNILEDYKEAALAMALGYALGRQGKYPELSSYNAIPRALLTTLDKCQNEGQILRDTNPWHPCTIPSRLPTPRHVQVVPGATNLPPPPPPQFNTAPRSGTSGNWHITSSIFTASGSLQLRLPSLPAEVWFKVAVILLLVLQPFQLLLYLCCPKLYHPGPPNG
ncbi:hypothetical protein HZS61_008663 [Fusarium oxysporum f. sp. conglutinans]|uniref:Uncharacterized protein n=1 Tax=Fusarium oxysporum f. sp. conglutinans TaxID=100902 RepID=A0A8H6LRR9_FUSOX|nr:hypothetical protein HZS61_008663 [Fusarium oxysporum f. sp. conglutinans]KAG6989988.1 hypothetical protein FocnCong_v020161 [Fusarium oxysporum f. sp. conglutinans]KAI8416409.1 hypothetical protein FOFC_02719 [Fusarium oxysporum]